jgi:hypothetical protein
MDSEKFLGSKRDRSDYRENDKGNKISEENNGKDSTVNDSVTNSSNKHDTNRGMETSHDKCDNIVQNVKLTNNEISSLIDLLCIPEKKYEIWRNINVDKIFNSNSTRSFFQKSLSIKKNKLQ